MSYQFEDDSALEELLNQQLDRRKQQYSASGPRSRPTTGKLSSSTNSTSQPRNYTAQQLTSESIANKGDPVTRKDNEEPASSLQLAGVAQSKLASWLDGKSISSRSPAAEVLPVTEDSSLSSKKSLDDRPSFNLASAPEAVQGLAMDESLLREDRLQEMSKQGLIRLILGNVVPHLRHIEELADERSKLKLESLRAELGAEREKVKSMDEARANEIRMMEGQHTRDKLKLEDQLAALRGELAELDNKHRETIAELENDYKGHIGKLRESYEAKLVADRHRYEQTIERRDEMHKNELANNSKLNCDLELLSSTMESWRQNLSSTLESLERKFGSCADCRQKSANSMGKRELIEQVGSIVGQLSELMPRLSGSQDKHDEILGKLTGQLDLLMERGDQLSGRERQLELAKEQLVANERRLGEQRLELSLDMGKLEYREQRLAELQASQGELEGQLARGRGELLEREAQLEAARAKQEAERRELEASAGELAAARDKLAGKTEELAKLEVRLNGERKWIDKASRRLTGESKKLAQLRDKVAKELSQLRRLQQSLICTICLDRLFTGKSQIGASELEQAQGTMIPFSLEQDQIKGRHWNLDEELGKLRSYMEKDARQLGAENKYIELLSMS